MKYFVRNMKRFAICFLSAIVLAGVLPTMLELPENPSIAQAASIKLSKTRVTLNKGKSTTLKLKGTTKKVTWRSSRSSVASVTSKGKVTAKKKGTATITAKLGSKKYPCQVTVKEPVINVKKVTMNTSNTTLKTGSTFTLKATVSPSNATNKAVTWSSSNASVASVSKGKVTAKGAGSATVTAKAGGKSASCKITVSAPIVTVTEPTYRVITSSKTVEKCILVGIKLTNMGSDPIRIYSSGSRLSDYDYYSYDRNLRLFDEEILSQQDRLVYLNYLDIQPGQEKFVFWEVQGPYTWYDYESTIIFDFTYRGIMYVNESSYAEGSTYRVK